MLTPRVTTALDRFPTRHVHGDYFCGRIYRTSHHEFVPPVLRGHMVMIVGCSFAGSGEQSLRLWNMALDTHVYISAQLFWFLRDSGQLEDC